MRAYVDTSAFYALLDADDPSHSRAQEIWERLRRERELPVTANYVVLETIALVQNRLGLAVARQFLESLLPVVSVVWVNAALHAQATATWLGANQRRLSLVDCLSFAVMRRQSIATAFTFDRHFAAHGFTVTP